MYRGSDLLPKDKPFGFYVWYSESSPFVDWLFNACLGLLDGQVTTYNEIHAEWTLVGPTDLRLGLLHGLAESDGSVSLSSKTIELWIGPSWEFGKRLLSTFGLRSFQSREAISVTKDNARKAARLPIFSPYIKNHSVSESRDFGARKGIRKAGSLSSLVARADSGLGNGHGFP